MSKIDKIAECLDLPIKKSNENLPVLPQIETMPDGVVESLKKNKTELNEIYRNAKKLLLNLIEEANDIARPRDVEVLTGFMKETTEILRRIRDIDKDIIDTNGNDNNNNDNVGERKINNYIFSGDTRDIIELVKELKKEKENIINADAKIIKN